MVRHINQIIAVKVSRGAKFHAAFWIVVLAFDLLVDALDALRAVSIHRSQSE